MMADCTGYKRNAVAVSFSCALTFYFRCARCLGSTRPIDGRTVNAVKFNDNKLEAIPEFYYLGICSLLAVVASWLRSHAPNVLGGKFCQQRPLFTNSDLPPGVFIMQKILES